MSIEEIIDKHYDQMFDEIIEVIGDDLYDFSIEVKTQSDGKTVRRSWEDREKRLEE